MGLLVFLAGLNDQTKRIREIDFPARLTRENYQGWSTKFMELPDADSRGIEQHPGKTA